MPGGQEPGQHLGRHRLRLLAQPGQAPPPQQPQHLRVAPLGAPRRGELLPGLTGGQELALHHAAARREPAQGQRHHRHAEPVPPGHRVGGERAVGPRVPGHQVAERIGDRLGERLGHAHRQRHAERVPQPPRVLDRGPHRLPRYPHLDGTTGHRQFPEPVTGGPRIRAPLRHLVRGQRAGRAQQVGDALQVAAAAGRGQVLQVAFGVRDDGGVEQLAQPVGAEQLGQQRRIERQGLRPAFGQRRVTFVHERADIAEQQGFTERAGCLRLHFHHPHPAGGDVPQQGGQRGHVEDVPQALPDGLEHDRERRVLARHLEQLRRTLPLLPQRRAAVRLPARQQQRPAGALAEPGREQRAGADLGGDEVADVIGVEQRDPGRRRLVRVGHPDDDPVVGVQRLHVHAAVPLAQPGRDGQRPRRVHPVAVRAVQHHTPVAELVPEPLHHQGPVVRNVAGGRALLGQVPDQVARGQLVKAGPLQLGRGLLIAGRGQLAAGRPDGPAELGRPPGRVAVPERQLARPPGRGRDQHPVRRDVLDPPGAGAQHEHVADPRLVHHFLVEFPDPARLLAIARREEHAEQPAVGDGAAAGDGEPLRAGPGPYGARHPVPDQARPQPGELLAGVAPGQHVQHRFQDRPGQPAERRGVADYLLELVHPPVVEGRHRDDLLGQHVQRVVRDLQFLDGACPHAFGHHCGLDQVALVLGEDDAAGDVAHVVPGPADPLQPAGHRRRRLDLDDQVHRAHVDAELQAGRGHHGGQPARLERLLDLRPLLPGHRAVVRPGHLRGRAGCRPRPAPSSRPGVGSPPGSGWPPRRLLPARRPARSAGRTAARPAAASSRTRSWTCAARSGRAPVPRRAARSSGAAPGPPRPRRRGPAWCRARSCPRPGRRPAVRCAWGWAAARW